MGYQQGLSGLSGASNDLDVIGNNIANANTVGFKQGQAQFADMYANSVATAVNNQIGIGSQMSEVQQQFGQGTITTTNQALDIAINGNGFFQVTMPDGTTSYTRDGSFQTNSQGQLVTSSGFPVSPAITIPLNATSLTIGSDGTVSITQPGSTANTTVGQLQIATFINPTGLQSNGENLMTETASSGTPNVVTPGLNGAGQLQQGFVEASNVNVVQELVNMIQTQRAYEINSKAVTTSDQMLQTLSQMQV